MSFYENEKLYVQGIYDLEYFSLDTNDLLIKFDKLTQSNFASNIDLNPIKAGIGNAIQIQIPTNAEFKASITAANLHQTGLALNVGATLSPDGKYHIKETIVLNGTTGTVSTTPVADYGSSDIVGWIVGESTAITIDAVTKTFTAPDTYSGETICFEYVVSSTGAQYFRIGSQFSPKIGRAVFTAPIYATENTNVDNGIKWGEMQIVIPKAQLDGNLTIDLNQTSPAATIFNLTALSFAESATGCPSQDGTLGYITYIKSNFDIYDYVKQLVVIGGGIAIDEEATELIIVKGITSDGEYENIPYSRLGFFSGNNSVATVDNSANLSVKGTVTGVAAGDTEITVVALDANGANLSTPTSKICDVEVTAL